MSLKTVTTIAALRSTMAAWRQAGDEIALVPTMGNLHAGHLQLVKQAQQQCRRVVVSIFVNPTQFGPNEDFDAYPRTEAEDLAQLQQLGVDLLFLPTTELMYPEGSRTQIEVGGLSDLYCGRSRPGHFIGVATIVAKLFNIVQADLAVFGEKDFQQLAVIRTMVRDLNFPIRIHGVATVREDDGLAMSSRNGYLSSRQRTLAPKLYQCLQATRAAVLSGRTDFPELIDEQIQQLQNLGFSTDYLAICRSQDLAPAGGDDTELAILVAAKLGTTRLIDNLCFSKT